MPRMKQRSTIGGRIRAARESRGWTRQQLAQQSGVSIDGIVKIENLPGRSPQIGTLRKLAGPLKLDLSELVDGTPERSTRKA